jgi:hypothetical protein
MGVNGVLLDAYDAEMARFALGQDRPTASLVAIDANCHLTGIQERYGARKIVLISRIFPRHGPRTSKISQHQLLQ